MQLTDKERALVLALIDIALKNGAFRSWAHIEEAKALKEKLSQQDASEGGKG